MFQLTPTLILGGVVAVGAIHQGSVGGTLQEVVETTPQAAVGGTLQEVVGAAAGAIHQEVAAGAIHQVVAVATRQEIVEGPLELEGGDQILGQLWVIQLTRSPTMPLLPMLTTSK
jgi:hypothetical protein